MSASRRAVVTGVGVVSAFGVGARVFFDSLAQGRAAVGPIRSFDARTFPTGVAGQVPVGRTSAEWVIEHAGSGQEEPVRRWDRLGAWRDRKVAFGALAGLEAWKNAGCGAEEREASVVLALGLEQAFLEDFPAIMTADGAIDWEREARAGLASVSFRSEVDLTAQLLSEWLDLRGTVVVNSSACAAGAMAVAHAASLIERGDARVVLCGGADSMVNPLGIGGMSRLGAPSPRAEASACRPFDRRRDGLAVGEGAAVFVLESEERARARGARMLARVAGWGCTQDAYRVTAPRPDGSLARKAMEAALRKAGLAPSAIGYVNAHGTGTPLNDPAEAKAIRDLFGAHADTMPVSSIKGAVGHLMAASGAIELAACLLPFERGILPGTAHHETLDPECPIQVIGPEPLARRVDYALSNSFGFGGQNASVILGQPEAAGRVGP